jgi:hypothetical protein
MTTQMVARFKNSVADTTDTRQLLEAMGIGVTDATDLTYWIRLPEGWTVQRVGLYINQFYDDSGNLKFTTYVKLAFYDRYAWMTFPNEESSVILEPAPINSYIQLAVLVVGLIISIFLAGSAVITDSWTAIIWIGVSIVLLFLGIIFYLPFPQSNEE